MLIAKLVVAWGRSREKWVANPYLEPVCRWAREEGFISLYIILICVSIWSGVTYLYFRGGVRFFQTHTGTRYLPKLPTQLCGVMVRGAVVFDVVGLGIWKLPKILMDLTTFGVWVSKRVPDIYSVSNVYGAFRLNFLGMGRRARSWLILASVTGSVLRACVIYAVLGAIFWGRKLDGASRRRNANLEIP